MTTNPRHMTAIIIIFVLISLISNELYAQCAPTWPDPTNTGRTQPVYIVEATIDGVQIDIANDWIGIYDGALIVGKDQVNSLPAGNPIVAYLEYTPPVGDKIPGAKDGNPMIFKIWDYRACQELDATIT